MDVGGKQDSQNNKSEKKEEEAWAESFCSGMWCFWLCDWAVFCFLLAMVQISLLNRFSLFKSWSQNHIIVVIHVIETNKNTVEMDKTWFWLLWCQLLFGRLVLFCCFCLFLTRHDDWWCSVVIASSLGLASSIHELQMCCLTKLKTKNIRISPKFKGRLGHAFAPLQRHQQCNWMGHCY